MKIEHLKPIPEKIKKQIEITDNTISSYFNLARFYSYITTIDRELVKVTVAVRNYENHLLIKQVAVHGVDSENCFVRDMEYNFLGISPFKVGWYELGVKYPTSKKPSYEDGKWYEAPYKYYNPYSYCINLKHALDFKRYKYSAIDIADPICPIKYLRLYKEFPQLEYLVKAGFHTIAYSKTILKKISKDKAFTKWLLKNKEEIENKHHKIPTILEAYRHNISLEQAKHRRTIKQDNKYYFEDWLKEAIPNLNDLADYILKQKKSFFIYRDYINACRQLGIELTKEVLFPKNLQRLHDLRINQLASQKAKLDEAKNKENIAKFKKVAKKYLPLEYTEQDVYMAKIAHKPNDLVVEGKKLNHCVGRMGYDIKMINEETLIFFIRLKYKPNTPLVTVEYSPSQQKILQCYAYHDTKPNDDILNFVNNYWLPYANKQIQQIAA